MSFSIPVSQNCVTVKVIDTTSHLTVPALTFIQPKVGDATFLDGAVFAFFVENQRSSKRVIFDLGIRKDHNNLPPAVREMLQKGGFTVEVQSNVADILKANRVEPESINSIIWSHHHMDHTGDPSTFPTTTELVVGPGFMKAYMPGYPINKEAAILESDYKDRFVREMQFNEHDEEALEIGGFRAFDFFGDQSFFLLDCPGHAIGHMCGLARTTPDTFILMGADLCHHAGVFRPTPMLPLPAEITPNPLNFIQGASCPCSIFVDIHPKNSAVEPFFSIAVNSDGTSMFHNPEDAKKSIDKLKHFDANQRVFVILAHDSSLVGLIDVFPASANQWQEKGWKELGTWRFLLDLKKS